MSTVTEIPEPIPKRSDVAKIARNVALRYGAHEGVMLEKMMRQNRLAEKMTSMAASGVVGPLELTPEEEKEMAVAIGNEYHWHVTNPAAALPAPSETPAPTPVTPTPAPDPIKPDVIQPTIVKPDIVQPVFAPVGKSGSRILPVIMAIVGTLGAGGIGAAALAIWNMRRPAPTPPVVSQPADIQDWKLGLEISDKP